MQPDLRCYYHPDREATSQCDRCGDYLCGECAREHEGLHVCEKCRLDLTPMNDLGRLGVAASIFAFVASLFWGWGLLELYGIAHLGIDDDPAMVVSMGASVAAIILAFAGARGCGKGRKWLNAAVATFAAGSALPLAVFGAVSKWSGVLGRRRGVVVWCALALGLCVVIASAAMLYRGIKHRGRPWWAALMLLVAMLMTAACYVTLLMDIPW